MDFIKVIVFFEEIFFGGLLKDGILLIDSFEFIFVVEVIWLVDNEFVILFMWDGLVKVYLF